MTNQVAITMLKNLEQSLNDYCELNDEGKTAFSMAITALELFGNSEQLSSAQLQWIPVSERLPELYKPVLVTGGDVIWICELIESPDLDDGEFQWEDKMLGHWYSFDNWDAWCPLPDPWKEEEG